MATHSADRKRPETPRRRFLTLLRREAHLRARLTAARAAGTRLDFLAAEASSIHWAIEQLETLYPDAVAAARWDMQRPARGVPSRP